MDPSNTIVVISRFDRDTAWTRKLTKRGYVVLIYEHGETGSPNNPYNLNKNKGKEASAYLKYIIDKYDSLPEYSVFLHDEKRAWHHEGNIADRVLDNQNSTQQYFNFNSRVCSTIRNDIWPDMKEFFDTFLAPYIGPKEYFGDWTVNHLCCAQFVCHRDKIRQHPRRMYRAIYRWIMKTDKSYQITGRLLEWTWRIIFNPSKFKLKKPINIDDPKQYTFDPRVLSKNAI